MGSSHSAPIRLEITLKGRNNQRLKNQTIKKQSPRRRDVLHLSDLVVGEVLRGTVRFQAQRQVGTLEEYEGIVLMLTAKEIWMIEGKPLRTKSRSSSSSRSTSQRLLFEEQTDEEALFNVETMITDFEFTEVGDGVDFTFPFQITVPPFEMRDDDDDDERLGLSHYWSRRQKSSGRSTGSGGSGGGPEAVVSEPYREVVFTLSSSLKQKQSGTPASPMRRPKRSIKQPNSPTNTRGLKSTEPILTST